VKSVYCSTCKSSSLPIPLSPATAMQHVATDSSTYPNAQPYFGIVENTVQALRLVQAAWLGIVPRIIRRLNDAERKEKIVSGAVFIFGVEESGMKRWTDGKLWSPSRIDGNFLVSQRS
jgi:Gti1/Pac2 family